VLILLDPPPEVRKYLGGQTYKIQRELLDDVKEMGGVDEVIKKYRLADEAYENKLSVLADNLDEQGFNITELESQISSEEFLWLTSNISRIKMALRDKIGENRKENR
jgi:hypothetical protein